MSDFWECVFFVAIIFGFVRGLTDHRPSIWRGFGEGLERDFWIVGNVRDFVGNPFQHELNKDYSVRLRKNGDRLFLSVDGN